MSDQCKKCKHDAHQADHCAARVVDAAGDVDWCPCQFDGKTATDPRIAFGAQPAEVELTDEDIKKFDLFTQEEIDRFMHWEMQVIRDTPYEKVKELVDQIRKMQDERKS